MVKNNMSIKRFVEAVENQGEYKFGVTVDRKPTDGMLISKMCGGSYPEFYLDEEDLEYLYCKYLPLSRKEAEQEKKQRLKSKTEEIDRKIEELNRLKEERKKLENE